MMYGVVPSVPSARKYCSGWAVCGPFASYSRQLVELSSHRRKAVVTSESGVQLLSDGPVPNFPERSGGYFEVEIVSVPAKWSDEQLRIGVTDTPPALACFGALPRVWAAGKHKLYFDQREVPYRFTWGGFRIGDRLGIFIPEPRNALCFLINGFLALKWTVNLPRYDLFAIASLQGTGMGISLVDINSVPDGVDDICFLSIAHVDVTLGKIPSTPEDVKGSSKWVPQESVREAQTVSTSNSERRVKCDESMNGCIACKDQESSKEEETSKDQDPSKSETRAEFFEGLEGVDNAVTMAGTNIPTERGTSEGEQVPMTPSVPKSAPAPRPAACPSPTCVAPGAQTQSRPPPRRKCEEWRLVPDHFSGRMDDSAESVPIGGLNDDDQHNVLQDQKEDAASRENWTEYDYAINDYLQEI